MRRWHLGLNTFWLLLGLGVVALSLRMPVLGPSGPGGGFLPLILGGLLTASSLTLLLQPVRTVSPDADTEWPDRGGLRRIGAVVAALVAFPILMPSLGFLLTSLAVMLCLLPAIARRHWLANVALSVAASGGIYLVFARLLGLNLPRGPWGF
ncbi:MAG: hypothetical protein JWR08_115 [Enterovirga sp.]|nr:hypothetical protein [Enterovirga sp.]